MRERRQGNRVSNLLQVAGWSYSQGNLVELLENQQPHELAHHLFSYILLAKANHGASPKFGGGKTDPTFYWE